MHPPKDKSPGWAKAAPQIRVFTARFGDCGAKLSEGKRTENRQNCTDDPCGEDDHMPVPGLVHRYPDRVLFLVTDRCAAYCRYCTRSRVVSGAGVAHFLVPAARWWDHVVFT